MKITLLELKNIVRSMIKEQNEYLETGDVLASEVENWAIANGFEPEGYDGWVEAYTKRLKTGARISLTVEDLHGGILLLKLIGANEKPRTILKTNKASDWDAHKIAKQLTAALAKAMEIAGERRKI